MNFEQFELRVIQWAKQRRLLRKSNYKMQFIKVIEELGELSKAILENNRYEMIDALGDVFVTLIILAKQLDLNINDSIMAVWNTIKDRKGKTINGTFIREKEN